MNKLEIEPRDHDRSCPKKVYKTSNSKQKYKSTTNSP